MRRLRAIALALGGGGLVLALAVWLGLAAWLDQPGPLREPVTVVIAAGVGVRGVVRDLERAGVVADGRLLEVAARLLGDGRRLAAGEYAFAAGVSPRAALEVVASGRVVQHALTIPEGLTVAEVLDLLRASELLIGDLPEAPPEGSLLPETWQVPRGEPRARVVDRMRQAMDRRLADAWAGRAPDLPLADPQAALTLASIVERETAVPAERPLVAAVLLNRLRRGMRLQADPTVAYGLAAGKSSLGRPLTRADLDRDHPWNTYTRAGLPAGPIANPGVASLEAALHPATVDHLYFVADGTGGHAFAATLEAHRRNVARWRQIEALQAAAPGRP